MVWLINMLLLIMLASAVSAAAVDGTGYSIDFTLDVESDKQVAIFTVTEGAGFDATKYSQIICIENWRDNARATEGDVGVGIALDHGATGAAFTGSATPILISQNDTAKGHHNYTGWDENIEVSGTATTLEVRAYAIDQNKNTGWNGGTAQQMKCYANWAETDTALEIWVVDHDLTKWDTAANFTVDTKYAWAHYGAVLAAGTVVNLIL